MTFVYLYHVQLKLYVPLDAVASFFQLIEFLYAMEYHSDADYNSRRVGDVVVIAIFVVVVMDFKKWIAFLCFD